MQRLAHSAAHQLGYSTGSEGSRFCILPGGMVADNFVQTSPGPLHRAVKFSVQKEELKRLLAA